MPRVSDGGDVIEYPIGRTEQILVFSDAVLEHFAAHRQLRPWHREAGGQLFARIDRTKIIVDEATGPRPGDRRSRTLYIPNRTAERREIEERFHQGLHFIGDWHTHPEKHPFPSSRDINSIGETVSRSEHDMSGFILVVVGISKPPDGICVLAHDGRDCIVLKLAEPG